MKTNKTFIIGKPSLKKRFWIQILYIFLLTFFPVFPFIIMKTNLVVGPLLCVAILFLVNIIQAPFTVRIMEYWSIRNGYLYEFSPRTFVKQVKFVWSVFLKKKEIPSKRIALEDIEKIIILWKTEKILLHDSHPIFFNIRLKDGTSLMMDALLTSNTQVFLDAIAYMHGEYSIQLEDSDELLQVCENKNMSVYEHIEKIRKEALKNNIYLGSNFRLPEQTTMN